MAALYNCMITQSTIQINLNIDKYPENGSMDRGYAYAWQ